MLLMYLLLCFVAIVAVVNNKINKLSHDQCQLKLDNGKQQIITITAIQEIFLIIHNTNTFKVQGVCTHTYRFKYICTYIHT